MLWPRSPEGSACRHAPATPTPAWPPGHCPDGGSGPSPPQPCLASPRSRLIRSTLLAFPFPPGKPTQPLRLFSAWCPGCGPEQEAGVGLGAAGPPPQAAALPRHRLGGDGSRGPQGRAADAGRQGTGRGDAAGSRSPHTRHGACCGDRDPRPLSMRDVGCSPACPSGYSPWQGALACSAGVQPMSPASVCLSVCLPPLCYGLPRPL